MNIYVFVGPTVRPERASSELAAVYLPPVCQGDVYRVTALQPFAIGIIDGYFDRVPAVWHKEILWAMSRGIHVCGAASMGALRAAELNTFGMKGVGRIYEDFRDGILEDDDEVAVTHSVDYQPSSEAMVNIRYTLAEAERQGIIRSSTRCSLVKIAKRSFYPDRTYHALLTNGRAEHLPQKEMMKLEQWLPTGRVDQKLQDAITMLRTMSKLAVKGKAPKKVNYAFEHTYVWEQLTYEAGELRMDADSHEPVLTSSVLEELRLDGSSYAKAIDNCLLKLLMNEKLIQMDSKSDEVSLLETIIAFREALGLECASDIRAWLEKQSITQKDFLQYMREEEKLQNVKSQLRERAERLLPKHLKMTGQYRHLVDRAAHKRQVLSQIGIETPMVQDVDMDDAGVLEWYFRDRFKKPSFSNLLSYVRNIGFRDADEFIDAIRREKVYQMQLRRNGKAKGADHSPRVKEQQEGEIS